MDQRKENKKKRTVMVKRSKHRVKVKNNQLISCAKRKYSGEMQVVSNNQHQNQKTKIMLKWIYEYKKKWTAT